MLWETELKQTSSFRNRFDHGVHGKKTCYPSFCLHPSFFFLRLLCASIGLRLFFHFLTLLCASIGLRRLFFIKYEFFNAKMNLLSVVCKKTPFYVNLYIFNNFGPRKTLDLVESILLTPVSSGLDETAVQLQPF